MNAKNHMTRPNPKPRWLRQPIRAGQAFQNVRRVLKRNRLETVCEAAKCPNVWECFSKRTATFLIMGPSCTRNCRFCAVSKSYPLQPDPDEPRRVAKAAFEMGLSYVVVTSVTRDDLPDGGSRLFAETIRWIRTRLPEAVIEVLVPDFRGHEESYDAVIAARPQVINHNMETCRRLYPAVRPEADYDRSLHLLEYIANASRIVTKSGLMLGLGESEAELIETLVDLRNAGCQLLTLGQYLQPSYNHLPVATYVTPEDFERLKNIALELGFSGVSSGPLVRSSYAAAELSETAGAADLSPRRGKLR